PPARWDWESASQTNPRATPVHRTSSSVSRRGLPVGPPNLKRAASNCGSLRSPAQKEQDARRYGKTSSRLSLVRGLALVKAGRDLDWSVVVSGQWSVVSC